MGTLLLATVLAGCTADTPPVVTDGSSASSATAAGTDAADPGESGAAGPEDTGEPPADPSSTSATSSTPPAPPPPLGTARASDCPTATMTVRTPTEFTAALGSAGPGTVIRLLAGRYVGDFTLTRSGTEASPIWICGSPEAVLTADNYEVGHPLNLTDVSDVIVTGFSVDNAYKGITVVGGTRITISDMSVTAIGYEAIHLRAQTVDSAVIHSVISRTGLLEAKYGEGVYLGTSGRNWCVFNDCQVDRSDRNLVRGNTITDTGAQSIEAKEGTTGGRIEDNTVTGTDRIEQYSDALITVRGNNYSVTGNHVVAPPEYGLSTGASSDDTWGYNNVFARNEVLGAPAEAIWIHRAGADPRGNVVDCSNTSSSPVLTNVSCTAG